MSSLDTSRPQPRLHWMDMLRGISVVLVAILHITLVQEIWDGGTSYEAIVLSQAVAPFRMPMLLFASGLLLARALKKPTGRYLTGKLRTLLWPWLIWSAVMWPITGWSYGLQPLWWINGMYTWFLMALFCYYLVGLLTRWIHPAWFALASITAWTVLPMLGVTFDVTGFRPDKFLYYAAFFFAGAALRRLLSERRIPVAALLPALVVAAGWAYYAMRIDMEPSIPVVSQLVVIISVIGVIGLAQRAPRVGAVRFVEWMGRNSIVIYLVHLPVVEMLGRYLPLPPGRKSFLVFVVVTLGVCLAAAALRPHISWLFAFPQRSRAAAPEAAAAPSAAAPAAGAEGVIDQGGGTAVRPALGADGHVPAEQRV